MGYPVVKQIVSTGSNTAVRPAQVPLPSSLINFGDLLVVVIGVDGSAGDEPIFINPTKDLVGGPIIGSNWNMVVSEISPIGGHHYGVGYLIATGFENGGRIDITFGTNPANIEEWAAHVIHIQDWHGSQPIEVGTRVGANNNDSSAVSITPSWNSLDDETLWIWFHTTDGGGNAVQVFPPEMPSNNLDFSLLGSAAPNAGMATDLSLTATKNVAEQNNNLQSFDTHTEMLIAVRGTVSWTVPVDTLSLGLSTAAPKDVQGSFEPVAAAPPLALSTAAPVLIRNTIELVAGSQLLITIDEPTVSNNFYVRPGAGSMTLASTAPVLNYSIDVSKLALSLDSDAPDPETTGDHIITPERRQLVMARGVVAAIDDPDDEWVDADRLRVGLAGQAPDALTTLNRWLDLGTATLATTGYVPDARDGRRIQVPVGDASFTGIVPRSYVNFFWPVPAGDAAFVGILPSTGPREGEATFTGAAPVLVNNYRLLLAAGNLSTVGAEEPYVQAGFKPRTVELTTSMGTPIITISSTLTQGQPGIEFLTPRYRLEFISDPKGFV